MIYNLSPQEVFNISVDHLIKQQVPCEDLSCFQYRFNDLKSVIGFLIPDEEYIENLETYQVSPIISLLIKNNIFNYRQYSIIYDLEVFHNNFIFDFKELLLIAEYNGLKVPDTLLNYLIIS